MCKCVNLCSSARVDVFCRLRVEGVSLVMFTPRKYANEQK